MSDYEVNDIIDRMSRHTQNLENHRYIYKILLIVAIVLLIVSMGFIGGLFATVKKEDRSKTFKLVAYISFGLIGTAIFILSVIVYFRYLKENTDNIRGLNGKVRQLGDLAKRAKQEASTVTDVAEAQKKRAEKIKEAARILTSDY